MREQRSAALTRDRARTGNHPGGDESVLQYTRTGQDGSVWDLWHTQVPVHLRGRGLGAELTRRTLDYLAAHGARVRPSCSFIRAYVDAHPAYAALVAR
jgi:uncharacterized protein